MSGQFDYDVFLSHNSHDKPAVRELAKRLREDGLRVWLDEWVIRPGDSIPLAIEQGLERSRTLILFMSRNAFASDWVTLERHTALFRDPTNQQRRFVPLLLEDCEISDTLKQFARVDWRERDGGEYERLLNSCRDLGTSSNLYKIEARSTEKLTLPYRGRRVRHLCLAPNGHVVACAFLTEVWIVDRDSGERLRVQSPASITAITLSSNGRYAAVGHKNGLLTFWDVPNKRCMHSVNAHRGMINGVSISADGRRMVTGSRDRIVKSWRLPDVVCTEIWEGHRAAVFSVATSSDGAITISGSSDYSLRKWKIGEHRSTGKVGSHAQTVTSVAMPPDASVAVAGIKNGSINVYMRKGANRTLEGHTEAITSVSISSDGKNLVSASLDGSIRYWDLRTGNSRICDFNHSAGALANMSSDGRCMVLTTDSDKAVWVWEVPRNFFAGLSDVESKQYTNAKVLLVGDSGVGKSGLRIRLTEDRFEATASTDAHETVKAEWATQVELPHDPTDGEVDREIWLWDFAGQADYRLIHQLFMDETALAVLVFNPQSEDPFDGLGQWDRDLTRAARREFAKLLVAGRCDRGRLMVSRQSAEDYAKRHGYAQYLETSAMSGEGCQALRDAIVEAIDWESIPWTTSPRIFKLLKDEILRLRKEARCCCGWAS